MKKLLFEIALGLIVGLVLSGALLLLDLKLPFFQTLSKIDLFYPLFFLSALFLIGLIALVYQRNRLINKIYRLNFDKKELNQSLEETKSKFETIFKNSVSGMALIELDGKLNRINTSLAELLNYTKAELLKMNLYQLLSQDESKNLQLKLQELLDNTIPNYYCEQKFYKKTGEIVWVQSIISIIRSFNLEAQYFMIEMQNITPQKRAEDRLSHLAYYDSLTSLPNRNKLEQFFNDKLAVARRNQEKFGLLFLDLDRFKNINDTVGHSSGDLVLQIISERLINIVRTTDMVARLGGDEFVLLVTDVKKNESIALIAKKILNSVMQPIIVKGQEIYITTSIGMSLYPYDGQNMNTLMKNADIALYRSKEQGGNNYQFYTTEMTIHAAEKLAIQNALSNALIKNEFYLNYQPKMDLKNRKITGIEALLRWRNPDYGMVTPDEIISLAEETGLIIPVSDWIIKEACLNLKSWHDLGFTDLSMAINCSIKQFKQSNFVETLLNIVSEVGIAASSIEIEITESIIMQDPENTLRMLYDIEDLGFQIVIDDFGTGYWSLNNLKRLSIKKIKIDRTFIHECVTNDIAKTIVRAVIAMAKELHVVSIAEGVETIAQLDFLAKEGCSEIQGYYLTRPLSLQDMTNFLKHPVPDAEAISKKELVTDE